MAALQLSIAKLLIIFITIYQRLISPLIGSHCRFIPNCSQYGIEVINVFGIKGIWLIIKRILKCSPLNSGGENQIPLKFDIREIK